MIIPESIAQVIVMTFKSSEVGLIFLLREYRSFLQNLFVEIVDLHDQGLTNFAGKHFNYPDKG